MLTSFFDILTTPIITFCIPMIFYISMGIKQKNKLRDVFYMGMLWLLGYSMMWITKWIISDLFYNTETIKTALKKIGTYTGKTHEIKISYLSVILKNVSYIQIPLIIVIMLTILSYIVSNKYNKYEENILYLVIAILPIIWTIITKNHCYIHARFTFRNFIVTAFALLCITMNNLNLFRIYKVSNKNSINEL